MAYATLTPMLTSAIVSLHECEGGYYDQRVMMWRCPAKPEAEPKYKPVATCPGCGAPMVPGAGLCGYCRRPHGS